MLIAGTCAERTSGWSLQFCYTSSAVCSTCFRIDFFIFMSARSFVSIHPVNWSEVCENRFAVDFSAGSRCRRCDVWKSHFAVAADGNDYWIICFVHAQFFILFTLGVNMLWLVCGFFPVCAMRTLQFFFHFFSSVAPMCNLIWFSKLRKKEKTVW